MVATDPGSVPLSKHPVVTLGTLAPSIEAGPNSKRAALFGAAGLELRTLPDGELLWRHVQPETRARAISWSQDGTLVGTGWGTVFKDAASGTILLHDSETGNVVQRRDLKERVLSLSIAHSKGCLVAFHGPIGGRTPDNPPSFISAFSLSDLSPLWTEKVHGRIMRGPAVRFSSDEELVVLEGEWFLKAWESGSWRPLHTLEINHALSITSFGFHPTENRLAAAVNGELLEIDTRTWETIRSLGRLDDKPPHLAYSPDGTRLAVAGRFGVTLRDTVTGAPLMVLPAGHTEAAAFTPDGEWILTASNDDKGFRAWSRRATE